MGEDREGDAAAIEPTTAMRLAFDEAPGADKGCVCPICLNHRLGAVLAIVARDHCLERRGHVWNPLAKWPTGRGGDHPHYCVTCSNGETAGPGCGNCRRTGMDQTPWPRCRECRS